MRPHHLYGFGYDHSRDDYLVVIVTYHHFAGTSHLEFFSLRDNMWNEIGVTPFTYVGIRGCDRTCGTFINGAIHWLARKRCHPSVDVIVVFVFDIIERKLFDMPLPDDFHYTYYFLWVFEEFLSLCAMDHDNHMVEIWMMKEYKQHSSWTKTIVIRDDHHIPFTKPVCGTKSGDIIGKYGDRLVKYNCKGQLLEYLPIEPRTLDLILYTESLFSLPDCEQV
jgi:F-box interacting protein